jgi:hypothetical protein
MPTSQEQFDDQPISLSEAVREMYDCSLSESEEDLVAEAWKNFEEKEKRAINW